MLNMAAVGGVLVSVLAPVALLAPDSTAEVAAPGNVGVEVVSVNGSGCPAGRGSATISADRLSIEVTTQAFFAVAGAGAAPTDIRKNCQVGLRVDKPSEYTYAVVLAHSSGFAYLGETATGLNRVSAYFQGSSPTAVMASTYRGPFAGAWDATVVPDLVIFAPCGVERDLNLNAEVRIAAGTTDPDVVTFMARDRSASYRLAWRRCPVA
jgi:hypothetical protein